MSTTFSRRGFIAASAATLALPGATGAQDAKPATAATPPFRFCLNTSTIRECSYQGKKVDILAGVEVVSKAGYSGIEPGSN